jgi:hypothetical protein
MMAELCLEILGWWLATMMAGSTLSAFAYPLFCRWIADFGPSLRSLVRLVHVFSAPVAAVFAVVLVTHPTVAGFLMPQHCHGNQCAVHTPVHADDSVILIGLAAAGSLAALLLLMVLVWAVRRGYRQWRVLRVITRESARGYRILDSTEVLACCAGLLRPQILLSQGMIGQLEPDELGVVLAHERAHAERLDNLRNLLLRWLTVFWLAPLRERACRDGRADAEQACDLAASREFAGSEQVAAVMCRLAELHSSSSRDRVYRSLGFDCEDAAARLAALESGCRIDQTPLNSWYRAALFLSLSYCVQIYLLTVVSHQLIEWLGSAAA